MTWRKICTPVTEGTAVICTPVTEDNAVICTPVTEDTAVICTPVTEDTAVICTPVTEGTAVICTPVTEGTAVICTPVTGDIAAISDVVQNGTSEKYRTRESLPWPNQGAIINHYCRNRRRSTRLYNDSFTSSCIGLSGMNDLEGCNLTGINVIVTGNTYRKCDE